MNVHTIPEVAASAGKRERILRASVEVFARNGYFTAKVSDIARAAGVADGTIYLYFQGKEDLLLSLFREHMRSYLSSLQQAIGGETDAEEALRRAIRFHLNTLGADRPLAVVFQVELRQSLKFMSLFSHEEFADYLAVLRRIIENGQAAGQFRKALNPHLMAKAVFGVLDEMVTSWVLSEKEYALAEQSTAIADFIVHGLA